MSKEYQQKLDDLNAYIEKLEAGVKKATVLNGVIYAVIIVLFIVYAAYIPSEVKKYASPEEGPATLVQLVDASVPSNGELLSAAKAEIPKIVDEGIIQIWSYIPDVEQMLLEGMSGMTNELVALIREDSAPVFKEFLLAKIKELKAVTPDLSKGYEREKFNEEVRIFVRGTLTEMVTNVKRKVIESKHYLAKYNKPDSMMTRKDIAEKKILLAFIRLLEDKEYHKHVSEAVLTAFETTYSRYLD